MTFTALFILAAFADPAAGATSATAPAAEQVSVKEEKKICKRAPVTESRMGAKRICKTAREWRMEQSDNGDAGNESGRTRSF